MQTNLADITNQKPDEKTRKYKTTSSKERKVSKVQDRFDPEEVITSDSIHLWLKEFSHLD
jgi:hypothetical protein